MMAIICPIDSENTLYDTYEFKEEIHTFNGDNYWDFLLYMKRNLQWKSLDT